MRFRTRTLVTIEYLLKGVFLGLAFALVVLSKDVREVGETLLWMAGSLGTALVARGLWRRRKSDWRKAKWFPILILTLLENPLSVHVGVLVGLFVGELLVGLPILWILVAAATGALLGLLLDGLLQIDRRWLRVSLTALLLAVVVGAYWLAGEYTSFAPAGSGGTIAFGLISSVLWFYVLIFAGRAEETEMEIGLLCLGLALALAQLQLPLLMRGMVVLVPVVLFAVYCERIRKNLIVFEHVVRGIGHEQEGNLRDALLCYRQALKTHPSSELANQGSWRVHRKIDLTDLADDEEIVQLIDTRLCLERARKLLGPGEPTPAQCQEIDKLLDIVECRRKDLPHTIGHERIRLLLATGDVAEAMTSLCSVLATKPPEIFDLPDYEAQALFENWSLALKHPLLVAAGGLDFLARETGLFSFIASLNRRLVQSPADSDAKGFEPFVYEKVTLAGYECYIEKVPEDTMEWFDYHKCLALGETLASDPDRTERAIEFFRIAEHGLTEERLVLWRWLGRLNERKNSSKAEEWYRRIKEFGLQIGPANLPGAGREAYFETVRLLAERAHRTGDTGLALENYQLFADSPKSGVGTLRTLKELHEQRGDLLMALRPVEAALTYSLEESSRRKWLDEKERLYAAISFENVQSRLGQVERFFDFGYCFQKAKKLFDRKAPSPEVIHYLDLAALGGESQLLNVNYLLGRSHIRAGNFADAALCLEQVRANRPEKFSDSQQEESFFSTCRLLGDLYLDHLDDPAKAIESYRIYKDYVKSGAETLYRLAAAYEANAQPAHARKWYDMVLVYPSHPKAEAARQALDRLG